MDSILNMIKKKIGIDEEDTAFDEDIISEINSSFAKLGQLGVGPAGGYKITDSSDVWNDFFEDDPRLGLVQEFIHKSVKLSFDPPASSAMIIVLTDKIKELEWRIQVYENVTEAT